MRQHQLAEAVAAALLIGGSLSAQTPEYTIELLGPGTVINDMNEAGEVVGWTSVVGTGVQAYVAGPRHPFEILPVPPGAQSAIAQGNNDAGVIVGSIDSKAAAWRPDGLGGYEVEFLGALAGHTHSSAYDVNNRGDVVGVSVRPGFQGGPTVWFRGPEDLVDLSALGAPTSPQEINDEGVIVGWSGPLFDIDTLAVVPLPPFPGGWNGFQGWAINDTGELAGTGIHGSQRSAAIWTQSGGWESISLIYNNSAPVQAFDINDRGLATAEIPGPAAHLAGVPGSMGLASLLPASEQSRWAFVLSWGNGVANSGHIAAIAVDTRTNQSGVALMTPKDCQADLGFAGPGTVSANFCGSGLAAGESSNYVVNGAPPGGSGAVLVSMNGFANAALLGGTLASIGGFVAQLPLLADQTGSLEMPFTGVASNVELVFQSVFLDGRLPRGVAFGNAILARFGQ